MDNKNTIAEMKAANEDKKQEKLGQSKWGKFCNWWKTKAMPWLAEWFADLNTALSHIRLPSLRTILVLAILVYMASNGALDEMPNVKWIVECTVRFIEWIFGAFRWLVELVIGVLDSKLVETIDILGFNEILSDFMKMIFGM